MGEESFFVKVHGKSFHCDAADVWSAFRACGANLFHRAGDRIVCNGCGATYIAGGRTDSAQKGEPDNE